MQNPTATIKIGLWGASSAGKTTFVAALGRAPLRHALGWGVSTVGPNGTEVVSTQSQTNLRNWQGALEKLQFPPPTQTKGDTYTWVLSREHPPPANPRQGNRGGFLGGRFGGGVAPAPAAEPTTETVILQVRDISGELFELDHPGDVSDEVMEEFRSFDGLIYLYDPAPSPDGIEELGTFLSCVHRLGPEARTRYLAACITKLDDSQVYFDARTQSFLEYRWNIDSARWADAPNPPASMETLFRLWAPGHYQGIQRYFETNRVAYFATTSSGFRSTKSAEQYWDGIDWDDVQNSRRVESVLARKREEWEPDGTTANTTEFLAVLNSAATPINVLEPFLWIYNRMKLDGAFQ